MAGNIPICRPHVKATGLLLAKRTVYITDKVFIAVYAHASEPPRDAMDVTYLTVQRHADTLWMTVHDIIDEYRIITHEKTNQPLRLVIGGALAELLGRDSHTQGDAKHANGGLANQHPRQTVHSGSPSQSLRRGTYESFERYAVINAGHQDIFYYNLSARLRMTQATTVGTR